MYLVGIESGKTKTHCIVGDEYGNVFAEGFGGSANYKCVGVDYAKKAIELAVSRALGKINIQIQDIDHIVLGMVGVESTENYRVLKKMCKDIFGDVPVHLTSDFVIALRAGEAEGWGVISMCSDGYGAMGMSKSGKAIYLRNTNYEMGNRGGRVELVREALHYGFRADEGVGPATRLQVEIPKLFGVERMEQVYAYISEKGIDEMYQKAIALLVVKLAGERDKVAQKVLIQMASAIGQSTASIIKRMGDMEESVTVVLSGSIFRNGSPLLLDAYMLEVHKVAPRAIYKILTQKPARGAYDMACEKAMGRVVNQ